jgi:hypothetical protein
MSKTACKRKYRVKINGRNFFMNHEGVPIRTGFYTTRFVEAANPREAESKAVELIKNDTELVRMVLNERDDSPMLYAEQIEEVSALQDVAGYTFYTDEDSQTVEPPNFR